MQPARSLFQSLGPWDPVQDKKICTRKPPGYASLTNDGTNGGFTFFVRRSCQLTFWEQKNTIHSHTTKLSSLVWTQVLWHRRPKLFQSRSSSPSDKWEGEKKRKKGDKGNLISIPREVYNLSSCQTMTQSIKQTKKIMFYNLQTFFFKKKKYPDNCTGHVRVKQESSNHSLQRSWFTLLDTSLCVKKAQGENEAKCWSPRTWQQHFVSPLREIQDALPGYGSRAWQSDLLRSSPG